MEVLFVVLGVVIMWVIIVFNQFVSFRNRAKNAYSNIDVMLKKRYDLVPQLVEIVKGFMNHEQGVLSKITQIRSQLSSTKLSENEQISMNNELTDHIGKVLVAIENYPDLKASAQFLHLQKALTEIEEQLSASRRSYNMTVTQYNTLCEKFPSNFIGKLGGFSPKILFKATVQEQKVPQVFE
jgi:LemA protein